MRVYFMSLARQKSKREVIGVSTELRHVPHVHCTGAFGMQKKKRKVLLVIKISPFPRFFGRLASHAWRDLPSLQPLTLGTNSSHT